MLSRRILRAMICVASLISMPLIYSLSSRLLFSSPSLHLLHLSSLLCLYFTLRLTISTPLYYNHVLASLCSLFANFLLALLSFALLLSYTQLDWSLMSSYSADFLLHLMKSTGSCNLTHHSFLIQHFDSDTPRWSDRQVFTRRPDAGME